MSQGSEVSEASEIIEVAAGVLLRENGREFLLAQRAADKICAGYWEFPGGKVEPGETHRHAMVRELQEELGITVEQASPWLTREFTYPHAKVRLKFFRIASWHGTIAPVEHSAFAWQTAGTPSTVSPILAANDPILRALSLPAVYAITHAEAHGVEAELARLERALAAGLRLIQIRDKTLSPPERRRLAEGAMALALAQNAPSTIVLINDDAALAHAVGAHGLHLSATALMRSSRRPDFAWVGASCHNADELAQAAALGLDFVVLGPVLPTQTHPEACGMGWESFAHLIEHASLPVYALGGMETGLLDTAMAQGAHGLAMMRGW